jgi:spermidine synthase
MHAPSHLVVYALFLLSGATALIYQVTWVRNLTLVFGASFEATSVVLASFMAGLACGSFGFGRVADRLRRPLRTYGLLELGVGVFALVLPSLLEAIHVVYVAAARDAGGVTPTLAVLRVGLSFAALILPTFFMGGTLPLLTRYTVASRGDFGSRVAWLYGINTLGAVAGALAAGFVLIPQLGVWHTQLAAVVTNVAIGVVAIALGGHEFAVPDAEPPPAPSASPSADESPVALRIVFLGTAVAGACALALEVLWTRSITIAVGSTTYSFTVMLAAFLVGIWLGSWLQAATPLRRAPLSLRFGAVLVGIGAAAFAASLWIPRLPELVLELNLSLYGDLRRIRPGTTLLLAFLVMLVPCILMGVAFPLASEARERLRGGLGRPVGDTLGLNTLGSIAGSLAAGFVLIPGLGLQRSMLWVSAVYAAYGIAAACAGTYARRPRRGIAAMGTVGILSALLLPLWIPPWDLTALAAFNNNQLGRYRDDAGEVDLRVWMSSARIDYYAEGRGSNVSVVERGGQRALLVNGKVVATDNLPDMHHELLLGHVPVLLHPAPRTALVVGLGAGVTLGAVAAHPDLEEITVVEIERAVVGATARFARANGSVLEDPRLEIAIQDGRNFLATTPRHFDVITADPIHPWAAGAVYLYTREYYDLLRSRIEPGGIVCQWLPGYELAPANFRSVMATFAAVFPHVELWQTVNDAVLIGSEAPIRVDPRELSRRLAEPRVVAQLGRVGLDTARAFLAEQALGDAAFRALAGDAVVNTDDNLHLEFATPRDIGTPQTLRNARAIQRLRTAPADLVAGSTNAAEGLEDAVWAKGETVLAGLDAREDPNARLRRVLYRVPDYGPARVQLAAQLAQQAARSLASGQLGRAVHLAGESVELEPDQASAHFTLGVAHEHLGDFARAIDDLRKAQALRPDDARLRERVRRLEARD